MKIDHFMVDCNLTDAGEISAEARGVLYAEAEGFLRAGGMVTWDFWRGLSETSRAAFIQANYKLMGERIIMGGMAAQGPRQLAEVSSTFDGGELKVRMAVQESAERLASSEAGR